MLPILKVTYYQKSVLLRILFFLPECLENFPAADNCSGIFGRQHINRIIFWGETIDFKAA
jgi:hypothetical protein